MQFEKPSTIFSECQRDSTLELEKATDGQSFNHHFTYTLGIYEKSSWLFPSVAGNSGFSKRDFFLL